MSRVILIVFLILTVASCKKKTNVVIQAQDYITGNGSAYAGMEYAVVEAWTPVLETKSKIVATGFLNDNGHAAFDLKMKNNRKYILGVAQPDNICYGGLVQYYLDHEKNNNVNFNFLTCGSCNINVVNVNCEGVNDEFRFKYYYSNDTSIYVYWAYWDSPQTNLTGCQNAIVPVYYQRPVGNYTIEWQSIRTSGTTTGTEYFTITENDSTTYVIEY